MSREIDERIVEMRFDNKQFESATKDTLGTLDKLRKALNLDAAAKSLNSIEKAAQGVNFSKMASSLEFLERRFSAFGTFTYNIIKRLSDDTYDMLRNKIGGAINYVSDAIKSGGLRRAQNLENAHFQLQALLKDEVKVQEVMANASAAVDGTAYSLDEAAKAASQFAASGISAGDDMVNALRGIVGVSAMTNSEFESISQIFTTVAGNGRLMGDQLLQLSGRGLNAASTLADFFNGVVSGSKQASDSTTAAILTLTEGLEVSEGDIRDWVSKGKISFDMFSEAMTEAFADSAERANETFNGALSNMRSAFARIGEAFYKPLIAQNSEVVRLINSVRVRINDLKSALVFSEEIGNVNALAKQWTDFVLQLASDAADWVDNVDLTKPLEAFYYAIESGKNVLKILFKAFKPIQAAFRGAFKEYLGFDWVVNALARLEELTSKFKITIQDSKNLRLAFRGIFDVISLVIEGVVDFIRAIIPCKTGTDGLGRSILGLTGDIGSLLSAFVEWVRESKTLNKVFDILTTGIRKSLEFILNINTYFKDFIKTLKGIPEVNKFIEAMIDLFKAIGTKITPYVADAKEELKGLGDTVLAWNWSKPIEWLGLLADKIQALAEVLLADDGVKAAADNASSYFDRLRESFSFENLLEKIGVMKAAITGVKDFVTKVIGPVFSEFNLGGLVAAAGGGGLIYALIKIAQSLETVSKTVKSFTSIPAVFSEVNKTLQAYQRDLNASALIKIAGAIGILTVALIALSFMDTQRLMGASFALSIVAGVLLFGSTKLLEAFRKGKDIESTASIFAKGLSKGIKNITKAVKWKAIGSAVKDMGKAIAYIAASIIGLALMYKSDKEAFTEASNLVAAIAGTLFAAIAVFTLLGEKFDKGMKNFGKAAAGIAALGFALMLSVRSIQILFNLEIPSDWQAKCLILGGVFLALAGLSLTIGLASRIGGGKKLPTGPILALAAFLYVSVMALEKLFKMELPSPMELGLKFGIFLTIFAALAALMISIGLAGRLAGGNLKATGTILAMCAFVAVVVGSIMILALIPFQKLISGAVALGVVLTTLGVALYGASKITDKNTYKSVLAMAAVVASIALSLGVLSMINLAKLTKACVALGAMLLIVAYDFKAISKIGGKNTWAVVASMAAMMLVITASLIGLAMMPWQSLLAATASLAVVLEVFADIVKKLANTKDVKMAQVLKFLAVSGVLVPIVAALIPLSMMPWSGLLSAGAALSLVLLSLAKSFQIVADAKNLDLKQMGLFLSCSAVLFPIMFSISQLAELPWEGLLAASAALSLVIVALGAAFWLISETGNSMQLDTIGKFLLLTVALLPIGIALAELSTFDWTGMVQIAEAMAILLIALAVVFDIIIPMGPLSEFALGAILAFDLFLASFALILLALGLLLENETTKRLLNGGLEVMGTLGQAIGDFVGNIIAGIGKGIGTALEGIGEGLGAFWDHAEPFFNGVSSIDPKCIQGIKMIAEAVLILTAADVISGFAAFAGIQTTSLEDFGKQLEAMAPSIKRYGEAVANINGAKVAASAAAVEILATASAKLPRKSEWVDKIFGTKQTLAEFGEELAKFGPYLKDYADSVVDIDKDSVEASAAAAAALAELSKDLPKHGGAIQEFFGDTDLEEFGYDLKQFGGYLVEYSQIVSAEGALNSDAIEASAAAGQIMVDLANTLPNSGGAVSWFTGDNDIDDFGEMLVVFGESMRDYSNAVVDLDNGKIIASATSAASLVAIANSLANSGGLWQINTGEKDLAGFGQQIKDFGNGIYGYYYHIRGISTDKMSSVTEEISSLSKVVNNLSSDGNMSKFVDDLKNAGVDGVNGFISAFKGSTFNIMITITAWATNVVSTFKKMLPATTFTSLGRDSVTALSNGIKAQQTNVKLTMTMVCTGIITAAKNTLKSDLLRTVGYNMITGFSAGITAGQVRAVQTLNTFASFVFRTLQSQIQNQDYNSMGAQICIKLANGMVNNKWRITDVANRIRNDVYNSFKDLGEYAAEGLRAGLEKKVNSVATGAAAVANAATQAARRALQEKSPSKVWDEIGQFATIGLANGLVERIKAVATSGAEVAKAATDPVAMAVDTINGMINNELDDLTLTPNLDLSQIRSDATELYGMFANGLDLSATYNRAMAAAGSFSALKNAKFDRETTNEPDNQSNGPTFIQNNYSPKALSRLDIYRQTQQQFTFFERMASQS